MRGKIFRDTNQGNGIILVEGRQKEFSLEKNWRSDSPPKVGSVVEVSLTANGEIDTISLVDEATLAKEQAQKAMAVVNEQGKKALGQLLAHVPASTLIALLVVLVSWTFLSVLNVNITKGNSISVSFYDLLKLVNTNGGSFYTNMTLTYMGAGFYGFLMWVALLLPVAAHFHNNKYLTLGYCAPLVYMLVVALMIYWAIQNASQQASTITSLWGSDASAMANQMMAEAKKMLLDAISIGFGFYISIVAAIYLALIGIKKYLVANA